MTDSEAFFDATLKIKDITEWSARWSTTRGTMDANATVADGVLFVLSLWVRRS